MSEKSPVITNDHMPYVPASVSLPEITIKAVILGISLSILLGAANAYLGLFAGITVSASIPAAVISMAVLRALYGAFGWTKLIKKPNTLENNIVQTSASAGESIAAGVIFTIPALIFLKVWTEFNYWETTMIAGFGGVLGVLFTIPLRRAFIVEHPLKFPEGIATAEILKVGDTGGSEIKYIAWAGIVGALFKLGESGLRLWHGALDAARFVGGTIVYIGSNLSPALVGVGYIVGLNIAVLIFIGGVINWWIFIPVLTAIQGVPAGSEAVDFAGNMWSTQTRYLGVGAMVVGGMWALIRLRTSLVSGIKSGIESYRRMKEGGNSDIIRTDRDTPMQWVGIAIIACLVPLFLMFNYFTDSIGVSAFMAVVMMVAGFLFSAVAAYMAGLVGSSNNPISGVTIATILTSSLLLLLLLGTDSVIAPAAAIFIGAVVCCAAAIAGDNMQDLKAGYIVGATPYKQQIMQIVGVVAAAFVMAPILTLLLEAYGLGEPTAAHPNPLTAPQATLMASVVRGVFGGGLPWGLVSWGMGLAVVIIMFDLWLEKRGSEFRTPVLAVAVGIYLPLELEVPILLGGIIAWLTGRKFAHARTIASGTDKDRIQNVRTTGERRGLLFAAGLITGEALVGILMAIPIVIYGSSEVLAFFGVHNFWIIGIFLLLVVMFFLYRVGVKPLSNSE